MQDSVDTFERRQASKKKKIDNERRKTAAEGLLVLPTLGVQFTPDAVTGETPNLGTYKSCTSIMTDMSGEDIEALRTECSNLRSENFKLRKEVENLDPSIIIKSDEKIKYYTGLANITVFMTLFNTISPYLSTGAISGINQFLLTLMRLRLNLGTEDLACRFGVSNSTTSRVFRQVIDIIHARLVPVLLFWPEREVLQKTMPMCFRNSFRKCTSIIDCFEIFIQRPTDLQARAQTYSHYKSHNTIKYLISIAPQGVISFISKGWGGRVSDKEVTEKSGFLDKLLPGDLVLADRGFDMHETFGIQGAKLDIPAFTKGKSQLHKVEIEKTRGLASVRIHVERVIGLARNKYKILRSEVPISLLFSDKENQLTTLDKVVHVACALTDISPSVVPFD